jgi:hypothetical protein
MTSRFRPHPRSAPLISVGQTFEGGISGQPNAEAHGAYAFCALGCLALLDHPGRSIPRYAAPAAAARRGFLHPSVYPTCGMEGALHADRDV